MQRMSDDRLKKHGKQKRVVNDDKETKAEME